MIVQVSEFVRVSEKKSESKGVRGKREGESQRVSESK